jgi:hypothetical protein
MRRPGFAGRAEEYLMTKTELARLGRSLANRKSGSGNVTKSLAAAVALITAHSNAVSANTVDDECRAVANGSETSDYWKDRCARLRAEVDDPHEDGVLSHAYFVNAPEGQKAGLRWWAENRLYHHLATCDVLKHLPVSAGQTLNERVQGCLWAMAIDKRRCYDPQFARGWDDSYGANLYVQLSLPESLCQILWGPGSTIVTPTPVTPTPAPETPQQAQPETIKLKKTTGNLYALPVRINDAIEIPFTIDTGASGVILPADVLSTLQRTGTINLGDYLGTATSQLADGSVTTHNRWRIHDMKLGNYTFKDVTVSITPEQGDALLGQAILSKLPPWRMDYAQPALVFGNGK